MEARLRCSLDLLSDGNPVVVGSILCSSVEVSCLMRGISDVLIPKI